MQEIEEVSESDAASVLDTALEAKTDDPSSDWFGHDAIITGPGSDQVGSSTSWFGKRHSQQASGGGRSGSASPVWSPSVADSLRRARAGVPDLPELGRYRR